MDDNLTQAAPFTLGVSTVRSLSDALGTATATPLSDLRAVRLLAAGHSVPFTGTGSVVYVRPRLLSDMAAAMDDYAAASCDCCGWGRMSVRASGENVPLGDGLFRTYYQVRCPECGTTDEVYRDWREDKDE